MWAINDYKRSPTIRVGLSPAPNADTVKLILNHHAQMVFFDTVTRKLVQKHNLASRATLRPIATVPIAGQAGLVTCVYVADGQEINVQLDENIPGPYRIEDVGPGIVAISGPSAQGDLLYLCADISGRIGLHAPVVSGWEQFVMLDVDRSYLTHDERTADSWLDKALARTAVSPTPTAEHRARSKPFQSLTRIWSHMAGSTRGHSQTPTRPLN